MMKKELCRTSQKQKSRHTGESRYPVLSVTFWISCYVRNDGKGYYAKISKNNRFSIRNSILIGVLLVIFSFLYPMVVRVTEVMAQEHHSFPRTVDDEGRIIATHEQALFADYYRRRYFLPWELATSQYDREQIRHFFLRYESRLKDYRLKDSVRKHVTANALLEDFPSLNLRAITVRRIDIKGLPLTSRHERLVNVALQVSSVSAGVPLFISHRSRDRKWLFVETGFACGWAQAKNIAFVDDEFASTWEREPLVAVINEGVFPTGGGHIGDIYPIVEEEGEPWQVLVPVKGRGNVARCATVTLPHDKAARFPVPLTYQNLVLVASRMAGQAYGWGGIEGLRDCSALIRDLYAPFGIWLPRHSGDQIREGGVFVDLSSMSEEEKRTIISACGIPYLTLLGMNGHIMLYVGTVNGEPMVFHTVRRMPKAKEDGGERMNEEIPGWSMIMPLTYGRTRTGLLRAIRSMVYVATIDVPGTCPLGGSVTK